MDLDSSENTTLVTGINMSIYIKFIASIWIGVSIWCVVGATLEYFDAWNGWFMMAGFWIYPIFNYINKAITD